MSKAYKITFTNKSKKNIEDNFFCKICGFVLSSQEDIMLHEKYECCHECFLTFAESRRKSWKEGWRPKKVDVNKFIKQRTRLIITKGRNK